MIYKYKGSRVMASSRKEAISKIVAGRYVVTQDSWKRVVKEIATYLMSTSNGTKGFVALQDDKVEFFIYVSSLNNLEDEINRISDTCVSKNPPEYDSTTHTLYFPENRFTTSLKFKPVSKEIVKHLLDECLENGYEDFELVEFVNTDKLDYLNKLVG